MGNGHCCRGAPRAEQGWGARQQWEGMTPSAGSASCRGQGDPFLGAQASRPPRPGSGGKGRPSVTPHTSPGGSGTFWPCVLGQEAGPGFLRAQGASST